MALEVRLFGRHRQRCINDAVISKHGAAQLKGLTVRQRDLPIASTSQPDFLHELDAVARTGRSESHTRGERANEKPRLISNQS